MKIKKILLITALVLYAAWLFLLCSSYILQSLQFTKTYFYVTSASHLQPNAPNIFDVRAANIDINYDFSQHTLHIRLANENAPEITLAQENSPLNHDGSATIALPIPADPQNAVNFYHLEFSLLDENHTPIKSAYVRLPAQKSHHRLSVQALGNEDTPLTLYSVAPNPFFRDIPSTIVFAAFYPDGIPYQGILGFDTIYGHTTRTDFPNQTNSLGIQELRFAILGETDLKLTLYPNEQPYERFLSFSLLSKNIQVTFPSSRSLTQESLELQLRSLANNQTAYLDVYLRDAWIYRAVFKHFSHTPLKILPTLTPSKPEIITLSTCLSALDCQDSANQQNLILSNTPLTTQEEAILAFEALTQHAQLEKYAHQVLTQLKDPTSSFTQKELRQARDFALAALPKATATPKVILNTKLTDTQKIAQSKTAHKSRANTALALTLGIGLLLVILFFLHFSLERKKVYAQWQEDGENPPNLIAETMLYLVWIAAFGLTLAGFFFFFKNL